MAESFDKSINRIAAIDWLRGIVMILMALDHASGFFNEGRLFTDSILLYEPGDHLATDQFLTRWITHICAPTFIFLTGVSIAISNAQRLQSGMSQQVIDRELWIRGVLIMLLDICVLSLASGKPVLQVLYAIGISMVLMVWLRRLEPWIVLIVAVTIIVGGEWLLMTLWEPGGSVPMWLALTFAPVLSENHSVLYPAVPWLAVMMLGWVFGVWWISRPYSQLSVIRLLLIYGGSALLLFVIIRGLNDYGNLFMWREGDSIVQWLHVSKYPPSLTYILLELGLMAIILACLIGLERVIGVRRNGFVLVFGQTALFFYLAHFAILTLLRFFFERGGLETAYFMTLIVLLILYPVCWVYRQLKWQHPHSILRFI